MIKKTLFLFLVLQVNGCGLFDYSVKLKNGYFFYDIGNQFITRQTDIEERQVIKENIIDYHVDGNWILVIQDPIDIKDKRFYWLVNMENHSIEWFLDYSKFLALASTYSLDKAVQNLDHN